MGTPITSYGIVLFYKDKGGIIRYLLAQRRDTIEYADFLRGRYSKQNLQTYFGLMTQTERKRLKDHSFEELWDDLWANHDNRCYHDFRIKAKAKFTGNAKLMKNLLRRTTSDVTEPGWGFPKGKKNANETDIECAIREFQEETTVALDWSNLLNLHPFTETFRGTNGLMYSTVYYIAETDRRIVVEKTATGELRPNTVSEEIADIRWCTLAEAQTVLPPWRQKLLIDIHAKITKPEN